jgi:hypothetical protein
MDRSHRGIWLGVLLGALLIGIASMPVAWAMPAHNERLQTVPTRTPEATDKPTLQPTSKPPTGPTATRTVIDVQPTSTQSAPTENTPPATVSPSPTASAESEATPMPTGSGTEQVAILTAIVPAPTSTPTLKVALADATPTATTTVETPGQLSGSSTETPVAIELALQPTPAGDDASEVGVNQAARFLIPVGVLLMLIGAFLFFRFRRL